MNDGTPRRELAVAVGSGAVAALAALFAASRIWLVQVTERAAPLPDLVTARTGAELAPALPAFALVALAGCGALLATRARARRLVGALLAAVGLAGSAVALSGTTHPGVRGGWVGLAAVAGLVVAACGVAATVRGGDWPAMGSRYERGGPQAPSGPGAAARHDEIALWDAIDRGEDPTGR